MPFSSKHLMLSTMHPLGSTVQIIKQAVVLSRCPKPPNGRRLSHLEARGFY